MQKQNLHDNNIIIHSTRENRVVFVATALFQVEGKGVEQRNYSQKRDKMYEVDIMNVSLGG